MRVLVIGGTGTLGAAVVKELGNRHEVVTASRNSATKVDITDPDSIRTMYREVGPVDAVVITAGTGVFAPLEQLTDADFELSLTSKLMGQVNLVRYGLTALRDGGSFTVTTGNSGGVPLPGAVAIGLVNGGLEGFVLAASSELGRARRINAVSPGWVSETLAAMGRDPAGGTPAERVAKAYVRSVEGTENGVVIDAFGK